MKKGYLFLVLIVMLLLTLFFSKGPIVDRIQEKRGRQTVSSIRKKYGKQVFARIQSDLQSAGFDTYPDKLQLLAFKEEKILEVYGRKNKEWILIKKYPFTGFTGVVGPKLIRGDGQIPEGVYKIEYLNPNSFLHLSAKVNYPNKFDRKKAKKDDRTLLGGDIFIHGSDFTIGCIPIGDRAIEELFIMLSYAVNKGVKVVISPHDFRINPTYPDISYLSWEDELYDMITKELQKFPVEK